MNQFKKRLLKLLGSPKRKYSRFVRRRMLASNSIEHRFTWIYKRNHWGNCESVSGPGSTLRYTENLRKHLPLLFSEYKVRKVLDAPCGDFNWMKEVVKEIDIHYVGADIVPQLVESNNALYKSEHVGFIHADITNGALPAVDLMICRDCLFHFSYADIAKFINNFCQSDIPYLLTTTHINKSDFENKDIKTSEFRLIDLHKPPFFFPEPLFSIDDWVEPHPARQMRLWSKGQVLGALKKMERAPR